jgi:hypothetical protein
MEVLLEIKKGMEKKGKKSKENVPRTQDADASQVPRSDGFKGRRRVQVGVETHVGGVGDQIKSHPRVVKTRGWFLGLQEGCKR